jgi:hypothetical protein
MAGAALEKFFWSHQQIRVFPAKFLAVQRHPF